MSFSLDISEWVKKAKNNCDAVTRKVILDVGTRLVMRSPVGDADYWASPAPKGYIGGRFRANWQYGDDVAPDGELPTIDPTGAFAIGNIIEGAAKTKAGRIHYIVNNLPYAQAIESGWSKNQAPNGVVGLTVVEFQTIVRDAARAVNNP